MREKETDFKIAILGNSNSIAISSYSQLLGSMPGIKVSNYSIGGVPNVMLLTFLTYTEIDVSNFDIIIIELAVVEGVEMYTGGSYTEDMSDCNFDLFMTSLRCRTSASVIVLISPTTYSLLEPHRYLIEKHYIGCAARHGAVILNGYNIIRTLGKLDPSGPPSGLVSAVDRFVSVFQFPPSARNLYLWRMWLRQHPSKLHRAVIDTTAFAEFSFEDSLHVSRSFHWLFANLIYGWTIRTDPRETRSPKQSVVEECVIRSLPEADDTTTSLVSRKNQLISRNLISISPGHKVTYRCKPGFTVKSILINQSKTTGYLNFNSPLGNSTIYVAPQRRNLAWTALIIPITDEVGDGDVTVSISPESPQGIGPAVGGNSAADVAGELGELVLVRRDWRRVLAESHDSLVDMNLQHIEAAAWATGLIADQAALGASTVDGVRRTNASMDRPVLRAIVDNVRVADAGASWVEDKARVLAAAGDLEWSIKLLSAGIKEFPMITHLQDMHSAITAMVQFDHYSGGD